MEAPSEREAPARPRPSRRPGRSGRRLLAPLLLFLLVSAGLPTTQAVGHAPNVLANSYRMDFGPVAPGEVVEGSFTLSNAGMAPGEVRFLQEGSGPLWVRLSTEGFTLQPGESRKLPFSYNIPHEAPPGYHGEAVKYLVNTPTSEAAPGTGQLTAGTAILVTSRTEAVGVTVVEAPDHVLPGMNVTGRALVVNTADANASVLVNLRITGAPNATVYNERVLGPVNLTPEETVPFRFNFTNVSLPRGEYSVEARVVNATENVTVPLSAGAFLKPLTVGAREARVDVTSLEDQGDGNATVVLTLRNTGTVPITFRPKLRFTPWGTNATPVEIQLDPVVLQPGEERLVNGTVTLPPGTFLLLAGSGEGDLPFTRVAEANVTFQMAPAKVHEVGLGARLVRAFPALALLTLAGALAVTGGWVVAKRRRNPRPRSGRARVLAKRAGTLARVAWTRLKPKPTPHETPPKAEAPLTDFLASLEAPPPLTEEKTVVTAVRRGTVVPVAAGAAARADTAALFVDVGSLYGPEDAPRTRVAFQSLRTRLGEREIACGYGYFVGETAEAVRVAYQALRESGLTPRVRHPHEPGPGAGRDFLPQLVIDAWEAARKAGSIVLATHDAAFTDLARSLRERGVRVEIMGVPHRIPVSLLEVADAVHPLPSATPPPRVHPFDLDESGDPAPEGAGDEDA